jgi:tRNA threonylcarbamoyladenosine biosynthesis protein TsaE
MERTIRSITEMDQFAEEFARELLSQEVSEGKAVIIGLSGDLGAGKTAFVQSLARALGVSDSVVSPTFVIAKYYGLPQQKKFSRLIHIDAYRIESTDELRPLGWEKILSDPRNLVVLEWPERISSVFPEEARILRFTFIDETTRAVSE